MYKMQSQKAEALAIAGLQHLAGDEDLLLRFCELTGILRNDIRQAAGQAGFLVGVLDFFLAHEPDLLFWSQADNIDPELVMQARRALASDDEQGMS